MIWRSHLEEKRAMARVVLARLERRAAELELGLERRIVAARRRVEALYLALTRRNDR